MLSETASLPAPILITTFEIFGTSKNYACKIIYPVDVFVGKNVDDKSKVREINNIKDDEMILDIGPKTIDKIKTCII